MDPGKRMPPPPQGLVEDRPLPSWIASKQSAKQLLSKRGYGEPQPATTTVTRVDAATAEDQSRLDHSNIKKSWKHPDAVAKETRGRERQKQNRNPQPIRPYAGGVRIMIIIIGWWIITHLIISDNIATEIYIYEAPPLLHSVALVEGHLGQVLAPFTLSWPCISCLAP